TAKAFTAYFGFSCVQNGPGLVMGIYHGIPPGLVLGGGTVMGLTLYRMVFGREYDPVVRYRPYGAIWFGAITGALMGVFLALLIGSVYKLESLKELGWVDTSFDKWDQIKEMFTVSYCALTFPLTSLALGLAFALMTNALRGSIVWQEFIDKQQAITSFSQIIRVTKDIFWIALPYSLPIWTLVPIAAVFGLALMSLGDKRPFQWPTMEQKDFWGAFDDPAPANIRYDPVKRAEFEKAQIERRTAWKKSTTGRILGLIGDCTSKMVGGFTCIIGMGLGIVLCRHGLRIGPRDIHG
ncbi:MAG: hypothetical protein ACAI35_28140, partial [Candidatus Methylacidiphilales bacterium]